MEERSKARIEEILAVIQGYANLDFDARVTEMGEDSHLEALSIGVNMLGEELRDSLMTVQEKEKLVEEKEILLREVHHRVKNNFQIISSLLNLQVSGAESQAVQQALLDFKVRVDAMALVHEMLYSFESLDGIALDKYLQNLVEQTMTFFGPTSPAQISFTAEAVNDQVNLDTAICLGLIVNELLTNVMKHAFPTGSEGTVRIHLSEEGEHCLLTIQDDGVGFDDGATGGRSLGLELVDSLVQQIEGQLELASDSKGTTVRVLIPCPH